MSQIEWTLEQMLRVEGITGWEREYRFHPTRKWRFDFAFPQQRIAMECEGGLWTNGRHTRAKGYQKDLEKYNQAALQGWTVGRFSAEMVNTGEALDWLMEALEDV